MGPPRVLQKNETADDPCGRGGSNPSPSAILMKKHFPIAAILFLLLNYFLRVDFFLIPLKAIIMLVAIPLFYLYLTGENPRDFGLSIGNKRRAIKYFLLLFTLSIPVMLYGATLPEFQLYYPIYKPAAHSIHAFLLFESLVFFMMFATEFFFRGFLLFGLRRHFPENTAILLHAIPYALVHIGKPVLEVYYSFFAGIIFAHIALRSKSILPSLALHFICSVVFDAFIILQLLG